MVVGGGLLRPRQPAGHRHHLPVEERRPQLEPVRHRGAVGLDQDVARQPGVDVDELHGGHVIELAAGRLVEDRVGHVVHAVAPPYLVSTSTSSAAKTLALPMYLLRSGRRDPREQALALLPGRYPVGHRLGRGPSPARQLGRRPHHPRLVVDAVAAEQLVRALAGEHDLHLPPRLPGDEPERDRGRVGHRIVEVPDDLRQLRGELVRPDHVRAVAQAERLRGLLRLLDLAVARAGEAGREGLHARPRLRGERADGRRVHPAGQERADRNVAAQVGGDRVAQRRQDALRGLRGGRLGRAQHRPPVAERLDRAARPGGEVVPGRQAADRRRHRRGRGHVLERQVQPERVGVDHRDLARAEERLALGGEPQLPAALGLRVVQRLDAERVPGAEQLAGLGVPDREGEHPAQPAQRVPALGRVRLEQDLGVRAAAQRHPAIPQPLGQLRVVVDLAVVDHQVTAVGRSHRLVPGRRRVDDRQPPGAEGDRAVREHPFVVRPAMRHPPDGAHGPVSVWLGPPSQREAPRDPRHTAPMPP